MAFDVARGTLGWPEGIDGRGVRNSIVDLYKEGNDIGELRAKYTEGHNRGDPDYMITWAGTGVGDMSEIKGAKVYGFRAYLIQTFFLKLPRLGPCPRNAPRDYRTLEDRRSID